MSELARALKAVVPDRCLVLPSSVEYEQARLIYNRMHNTRPAALVRTLDPAVLHAAATTAARLSIPIAVRGGGHHIGGFSSVDGGLVLDFSPFREVDFDESTGFVRVSPGARLGDVDLALAEVGRCVPAGTVSDTGITGLTLGGGVGWLVAGYGLTCDYLNSAEVLLADGRVIEVSPQAHADLFKALRGGGMGAFGVVLSLYFRTVPLPRIKAGAVRYALSDAPRVLTDLHSLLASYTPETVTLAPVLDARSGVPGLSLELCCHSDDERDLDRIRTRLGGDWSDVRDRPYVEWQSVMDDAFQPPMRGYWKSVQFCHLDVAPSLLVEAARSAPDDRCSVLVEYYNPATLRTLAEGSAFPLRDSRMGVLFAARWHDSSADKAYTQWARRWSAALGGGSGAYSNYSQDSVRSVRSSFPRGWLSAFRDLEVAYDPERLFARGHRAALNEPAVVGRG